MGWSTILAPLLALACATSGVLATKKAFNVNDDILAFPQFQVHFPDGYVLDSHARELLQSQVSPRSEHEKRQPSQKDAQVYLGKENGPDSTLHADKTKQDELPVLSYEEMILDGQRYLCQIPEVETGDRNQTTRGTEESSEADARKELDRATDRGLELLREMEGKCMYYVSGWWSYSFCYKKQIKQFHALPSGAGVPHYPPMEDPTTHSFVLGRFSRADDDDDIDADAGRRKPTTDVAELQIKGGSRYLVQRLEGGTRCDLTGRNRKIEIQFHCHPQSTDRIGWIKELTTCSYLMVIYTPRLCNDVAFLPPQQDEVHTVECREVLTPEEVPEWEAMQRYVSSQHLVEAAESTPQFAMAGDIEVGAQKLVGTEGKRIEKGRVASAGEEKVEVVAKRENGEVHRLSKEDLKKYDLDPEKIETLRKRLEELANGKDWTLEVVEANGERGLRGIVDADEDEEPGSDWGDTGHEQAERQPKKKSEPKEEKPKQNKEVKQEKQQKQEKSQKQQKQEEKDSEKGSEEIFKDEL